MVKRYVPDWTPDTGPQMEEIKNPFYLTQSNIETYVSYEDYAKLEFENLKLKEVNRNALECYACGSSNLARIKEEHEINGMVVPTEHFQCGNCLQTFMTARQESAIDSFVKKAQENRISELETELKLSRASNAQLGVLILDLQAELVALKTEKERKP